MYQALMGGPAGLLGFSVAAADQALTCAHVKGASRSLATPQLPEEDMGERKGSCARRSLKGYKTEATGGILE